MGFLASSLKIYFFQKKVFPSATPNLHLVLKKYFCDCHHEMMNYYEHRKL